MNIIHQIIFLCLTTIVNCATYGHDVGANIPPLAFQSPPSTILNQHYVTPNTTKAPRRPVLTRHECGVSYNMYYNRIVGGEIAVPAEFPWLVSVQVKYPGYSGKHICGGTILNERWLLTAAHCLDDIDLSIIELVAGDYNLYKNEGTEQRRLIDLLVTNSFNANTFARDIALVRVNKRFRFNKYVGPICLPGENEVFSEEGIIAGWGRLSEYGFTANEIHKVALPFVSMTQCTRIYTNLSYQQFLSGCQICAGVPEGGKDACQGDSGGPMICQRELDNKFYLCGIVSWGIGCARPDLPGVYTQVSCYSNWIESVITNKNNILGYYWRKEKKPVL